MTTIEEEEKAMLNTDKKQLSLTPPSSPGNELGRDNECPRRRGRIAVMRLKTRTTMEESMAGGVAATVVGVVVVVASAVVAEAEPMANTEKVPGP